MNQATTLRNKATTLRDKARIAHTMLVETEFNEVMKALEDVANKGLFTLQVTRLAPENVTALKAHGFRIMNGVTASTIYFD